MADYEKDQIFLVVDKTPDDNHNRMDVMEIHQKLSIPCVNTFLKDDFEVYYRPTKEEKLQIQNKSFKLQEK